MTVVSPWLQRRGPSVLSSRCSSEPLYSLGIAVSLSSLRGRDDGGEQEGSWVEGTAGAQAWRPEFGPSRGKERCWL